MITKHIAKKMKFLGYPFLLSNMGATPASGHLCMEVDGVWYYTPSFDEVIKSCKGKFWSLETLGKRFIARAFDAKKVEAIYPEQTFQGQKAIADSGLEALCLLWCKLNEK